MRRRRRTILSYTPISYTPISYTPIAKTGYTPIGATPLEVAASFATLVGMSKVSSLSDSQLNAAIQTATLAKGQNIPGASDVLTKLKQEQARRKGYSSGDNTKLYLLLGGAGLAAAWFFFIRK